MAIVFKKKVFREDPTIDFYRSSAEFENYVKTTYIDTGKISVWRQEEYLDETLQTIEYETIYRDQAAFDEALADPEFKKDADEVANYCYYNLMRLLSIQVNDSLKTIECDPTRTSPVDVTSIPS